MQQTTITTAIAITISTQPKFSPISTGCLLAIIPSLQRHPLAWFVATR
jgi:hypothetical protein